MFKLPRGLPDQETELTMRKLTALLLAIILTLSMPTHDLQAAHELEVRDIVAGASLYRENCASCHGANLEGQPNWRTPNQEGVLPAPPHDETGHTWHHDNQLLFDYTKMGGQALFASRGMDLKSGMPGFSVSLSDDEI